MKRVDSGPTTLSLTTFSITTLYIKTFSIMTLSITTLSITINKSDIQHFTLTQLCCWVTRPGFTSVIHELRFASSWITTILDPTVWLDGASPTNTCIQPSFPWMALAHRTAYPPIKSFIPSPSFCSWDAPHHVWPPSKGRRAGYRCWPV